MGAYKNNFVLNFVRQAFSTKENPPYYQLQKKHLNNVVVLPTRIDLLEQLPKNAIIAEVGVAKGRFSEKILNITRPKTLHLIDSWQSKLFGNKARTLVQDRFKKQIELGIVKVRHGCSTDVLFSFPDKYFDWVYLDTDHTYTTTHKELELCRQKVKPGGIIAGHDYTPRHYRNGNVFGVAEAVNEFCFKHSWKFVLLTHETHRHLSFALKKIGKKD